MILSSCGCKVSWALRGGMRHLRMPLLFFRLAGVATIRKNSVDSSLFANRICSQSSTHIHLKICGFFDGDGSCVGSADKPFCFVCQPQERGTLLLSLPGRDSPAVAFGYATVVKIRLPRLFPLFPGGCGFVLRIELAAQHGVQLLLQSPPDVLFKIFLAVQMIQHQIHEQVIGDLHIFHRLHSFP